MSGRSPLKKRKIAVLGSRSVGEQRIVYTSPHARPSLRFPWPGSCLASLAKIRSGADRVNGEK